MRFFFNLDAKHKQAGKTADHEKEKENKTNAVMKKNLSVEQENTKKTIKCHTKNSDIVVVCCIDGRTESNVLQT